jgi:lipopolysaccharide export system protein LptC
MNSGKQAAWLFLILIACACSGWYFASASPVVQLDDHTLSRTNDIVIHHLTVRQYDAQGNLVHLLKTPHMKHIPLNDSHWVQSPHIIVTQNDKPAWDIRSREAHLIHGGEKITFRKDVVIHQPHDAHATESTIKTEELVYFPKKQFASTRVEIAFEQPGNIIHSNGMNAYLAEKRVQLLNKARGTYVPKHA